MGSTYFKKRIKHLVRAHNLFAKKKPKVFKSEASAKKWADANEIKDYSVVPAGTGGSKFKIAKK